MIMYSVFRPSIKSLETVMKSASHLIATLLCTILALPANAVPPKARDRWNQCMRNLTAATQKADPNLTNLNLALLDGMRAATADHRLAAERLEELEAGAQAGIHARALCNSAALEVEACQRHFGNLAARFRRNFTLLSEEQPVNDALRDTFYEPHKRNSVPFALLTNHRTGFRMILPASLHYPNPRRVLLYFAPDRVSDGYGNTVDTFRMNIKASKEEASEIIQRLQDFMVGGDTERQAISTAALEAVYPLQATWRGLGLVGGVGSGTLTLSMRPQHASVYDNFRIIYALLTLFELWPE